MNVPHQYDLPLVLDPQIPTRINRTLSFKYSLTQEKTVYLHNVFTGFIFILQVEFTRLIIFSCVADASETKSPTLRGYCPEDAQCKTPPTSATYNYLLRIC